MANTRTAIHAQWSSRVTFVLAATGSAVGLGNIWKFPYITGENGGGAFVLIYLFCVAVIGVPIIMAETMLGRRGQRNPIMTMDYLAEQAKVTRLWRYLGWMGVVAGFMILSYYSVIAGKTIAYVLKIMTGLLSRLDVDAAEHAILSLNDSVFALTVWHSVFMVATMYIVARGVNEGIEQAIKFLMPGLFLILLVLVMYAMTTDSFAEGMSFMFSFDLDEVSTQTVLLAMGQAFFTLSLGMGAIMVYGSYLPRGVSIGQTSVVIALADTSVAILAGIAIFPIVFANGFEPGSGPDLIFKTLPMAFSGMFAGTLFGLMFFILLVFAALSSSISLIEPAVSYVVEKYDISRERACIIAGAVTWTLGMGTVFSNNIWAETKILGKTFFGLLDFISANLLLPLGGILMAIFAGWIMTQKSTAEEFEISPESLLYKAWRLLVRYVAPVAVAIVLIAGLIIPSHLV